MTMKTSDGNYRIFSRSATKAGKEKCGDAFVVRESKEEGLVILAVADGVSTLPCDWLASKTACESLIAAFAETTGDLSDRMKTAVGKAASAVRSVRGSCAGMMTSLSFAIWRIGEDAVHFVNVGDSRIYVGADVALKQITVDDTDRVVVKSDGRVLLNAGMPVVKSGVTKSLGQNAPLALEVRRHEFFGNDLLALVSDGVCKNEAFARDIESIFSWGDPTERLSALVERGSEMNGDDATLVLLWRSEKDERARTILEACVENKTDFRQKGVGGQAAIGLLQNRLVHELNGDRNDRVKELLDYAARFGLKFERTFLSDFLSLVIKQGIDRDLVFRLRELIKSAA